MNPAEAGLFTDLYELTMMQGYWSAGRVRERGCFELFFRRIPEGGGYCLAAGIDEALRILADVHFTSEQIDYLESLKLFQPDFLDGLRSLRFTGEVRAVADGTVVFPNEPLLEVCAPLLEAQWVETLLLNCINFHTLIATKASRIARTAAPATVIEFGLRRAQGPNGGRWVTRAAFLGGCIGTSNVEAGFLYGIPVYGTHAHSWVMSFPSEADAFRAYGETFPDKSILLIDTYDTLNQGLPNAIAEAKRLAATGHRLAGVRLDSGDLAYLSKECRRRLDEVGLNDVKIVASSDIDEYVIQQLKVQEAPIDTYGVGTRLATAYQEPALGGVYKLVAIEQQGRWLPKMKVSSNPAKTTIPGQKQLWRWESSGKYLGDVLSMHSEPAPNSMQHPDLEYKRTAVPPAELRPLLELCMKGGKLLYPSPSLEAIRTRAADELRRLPLEHQRLANPHTYRVGLSTPLWNFRREMIAKLV